MQNLSRKFWNLSVSLIRYHSRGILNRLSKGKRCEKNASCVDRQSDSYGLTAARGSCTGHGYEGRVREYH